MEWTKLLDKNGQLDMRRVCSYLAKGELDEDSFFRVLSEHPEVFGTFDRQCYEAVIYPSALYATKTMCGAKATVDGVLGKKTQSKISTDKETKKKHRQKAKELIDGVQSDPAQEPEENRNARPRSEKKRDRGVTDDGIDLLSIDPDSLDSSELKDMDMDVVPNHCYPDNYEALLADGWEEMPAKTTFTIGVRNPYYWIQNIIHTLRKVDEFGQTHFISGTADKVLPKTRATSEMASDILYKYNLLAQPINRQVTDLAYRGFKLDKSTLLDWRNKIVQIYFYPVVEFLLDELLRQAVIHGDETTWKALMLGKMTYMMVLCSGEAEEKQIVVYKFLENRKQETFKKILKDFEGYFISDNAKWYSPKVIALILHALCWAHGRKQLDACYKEHKDEIEEYERILKIEDPIQKEKERKAFEMGPNHQTFLLLRQALECISVIYDNEQICKENKTMPNETRLIREGLSTEPVEVFFNTLEQLRALSSTTGKSKNACDYWLKNRDQFELFLHDGRIDIDNNFAERCIKMMVILRDNCEFSATVEGAEVTAASMSIMMTATANGLNPRAYSNLILNTLKPYLKYDSSYKEYWIDCPDEVYESLMPWSPSLPRNVYISKEAWLEAQKRFGNHE